MNNQEYEKNHDYTLYRELIALQSASDEIYMMEYADEIADNKLELIHQGIRQAFLREGFKNLSDFEPINQQVLKNPEFPFEIDKKFLN